MITRVGGIARLPRALVVDGPLAFAARIVLAGTREVFDKLPRRCLWARANPTGVV